MTPPPATGTIPRNETDHRHQGGGGDMAQEAPASGFYGEPHRQFQTQHGTCALADRLEAMAHAEFTEDERAFVESRTMFFLSTVDHLGRPTVSYKGGAPGFVRIAPDNTVQFPCYDGNGMFLSLGNIAANPQIGMLFIDFEEPRRLRLQGTALVLRDPDLLVQCPGALYVVSVRPEAIFVNCGRYIHRSGDKALSPHIPDRHGRQPFPAWKRLDIFSDVLPEADRSMIETEGGTMPLDAYRGEHHAAVPKDDAC
jgi:hypothetical protein